MAWAVERCRKEHTPAYLEGTIEARRLYEKFNFQAKQTISIDLDDLVPGGLGLYEEICFLLD